MEGDMEKKPLKSYAGLIVMLGAVWGLSEAALGMYLKRCASSVSGSVMTGFALFFIAATWFLSRRVLGVVLLVVIASIFKVIDALLLSYPLLHGAIGNPIFAFITEGAAFLLIVFLIKETFRQKPSGQALAGGMSALLAANLFPLVKFATGVPPCVVAGTGYPLSLYYIHFAVLISIVTVPLGFLVGARLEKLSLDVIKTPAIQKLNFILTPAAFILCLIIMALMRLV
jgi:hypothetical protein